MGSDGLAGVRGLKASGGQTIAQDAESCVVYGMPRAVVEAGMADVVLPIDRMVQVIEGAVG
jgi:two-component system chemotaxis response regulator CheB